MPNKPAPTFARAAVHRRARIVEQVAPLVIQGKTIRQVAETLGIGHGTAQQDVRLVHSYWKEQLEASGEQWSAAAVQHYERVLAELYEQWEKHKDGKVTTVTHPDGTQTVTRAPADLKPLSAIVATIKELTTFLGLRQPDQVQSVQIDSTTVNALAPMNESDYLAMVNSGGLTVNAVSVPAETPADPEPQP